ncbi:MAG: DoxX family protein [Propionibacteriales bacterium]|nr:DoxX family protein [Propionibacteriales bacterium]
MDGVLWGAAVLLAIGFGFTGSIKLLKSSEELARMGMGWTEDFSPGAIKAIGALELTAVVGLILPPLLDIAPILAPLAALGLIFVMVGAAWTHIRREENHLLYVIAVLLVLAIVVAWGRFGPYPFD